MNLPKKTLIAAGLATLVASMAYAHEQQGDGASSQGQMMGNGMGMMHMMDMEQMQGMMARCNSMMERMEKHLDEHEAKAE